jgi:hypothetical protein
MPSGDPPAGRAPMIQLALVFCSHPHHFLCPVAGAPSLIYELQGQNGRHSAAPSIKSDNDLKDEPVPEESTSVSSSKMMKKPKTVSSIFYGILVGFLLLDLPLLSILLLYSGALWFGHVQNAYLIPQYHALKFTRRRSVWDNTYYTRVCDADDMTTRKRHPRRSLSSPVETWLFRFSRYFGRGHVQPFARLRPFEKS